MLCPGVCSAAAVREATNAPTVNAVIHEVDESLRKLIERDAVHGGDVEVVFEAPTKDWASRRNTPTVDCYLYDIREDIKRRSVGVSEQRGVDGRVESRQSPARYFKLAYLLTAWTQRPEDEHRILSSLLTCFLRSAFIPQDCLMGSLASLRIPVFVSIAQPPPENRQVSDVWSALGGELKPSLDLVISAPLEAGRHEPMGPPITTPPRFGIYGAGGQSDDRYGPTPPPLDEGAEGASSREGTQGE